MRPCLAFAALLFWVQLLLKWAFCGVLNIAFLQRHLQQVWCRNIYITSWNVLLPLLICEHCIRITWICLHDVKTKKHSHTNTFLHKKYDVFTKSSKPLDLSIQIGFINYIVRKVMNVHCAKCWLNSTKYGYLKYFPISRDICTEFDYFVQK